MGDWSYKAQNRGQWRVGNEPLGSVTQFLTNRTKFSLTRTCSTASVGLTHSAANVIHTIAFQTALQDREHTFIVDLIQRVLS